MNERIKELAYYAGMRPWGIDNGDNVTEIVEKFAELIIRECAAVADCHWRNQCPGLHVKEHFGLSDD